VLPRRTELEEAEREDEHGAEAGDGVLDESVKHGDLRMMDAARCRDAGSG
jgi:hypothetical protein